MYVDIFFLYLVSQEHLTQMLCFRVIHERNFTLSMETSFFAWNMEISFFVMPLYILDMCPENRDESNGNSIIKLWLQFIPIFGALHSQLRKGHTTKKDISMFLIYIAFPKRAYNKKRHLHALFHI